MYGATQIYYQPYHASYQLLSIASESNFISLDRISDILKLSCTRLQKILGQKHSLLKNILPHENIFKKLINYSLFELSKVTSNSSYSKSITNHNKDLYNLFNRQHLFSQTQSSLSQIQRKNFHLRSNSTTQMPFQRRSINDKENPRNASSLYESLKDIKDPDVKAKILESVAKLFETNKSSIKQQFQQQINNSDLIFLKILKYIFAAGGLLTLYLWIHHQPSTISTKSLFPTTDIGESIRTEKSNITFNDVCGIEEAKHELREVVNFLENPSKYTSIGAKLPKGILLHGPPGNGKTMLAKAVSGQARVPFFHISGSQFDEQFVGVGAKRVRELFKKASDNAPCVIFIDEIDSVGGKRTTADLYPYANQTINQLLAELDGFVENSGVIVIGATNRPDNLDSALLRPGRFDTHVYVGQPDLQSRKELFSYYSSKIHVDPNLSYDKIAYQTSGFSAADISNIVNQAALRAALKDKAFVDEYDLMYAFDKITMGPENKHKIVDREINWTTAIHEAGHALVSYYTPGSASLDKLTILSRGASLGLTSFVDKNEYSKTKSEMFARVDVALGGRAAEELIFGEKNITTGCVKDLQKASSLLQTMIVEYGMDSNNTLRSHSDSKVHDIIERELKDSYCRATKILNDHKEELIAIGQCLMQYETLNLEQFKKIIDRKANSHKDPENMTQTVNG